MSMAVTQDTISLKELINTREGTHGVFRENALLVQGIKDAMRLTQGWSRLEAHQKEALDMIAHKITRILHGDPNHRDHWEDIAGYAQRVASYLE